MRDSLRRFKRRSKINFDDMTNTIGNKYKRGKNRYRTYRATSRENNRVKKHKKKMDKLGKKRAKR